MDTLPLWPEEDNTSDIPLKRCTACDNQFPATFEYFYRSNRSKGKCGLESRCKACRHVGRKSLPKPHDVKRCTSCGHRLPATTEFFYRNGDSLHSQCKSCILAHQKMQRSSLRVVDDLPPGHKRCPRCERCLPATTEFFHKQKIGKSGYQSYCKECRNATKRAKRNPDPVPQGYKRCTKCQELLPATLEFFSRQSMVKSGLRSYCKTCAHKSHLHYYSDEEVRERENTRARDYRNRPEIRVHRHQHSQVYLKRPAVIAQMRLNKHRRRAFEKSAQGTYTAKQIQEQYTRQKGKCYYCRCQVKWGQHHVDHVIPLSRGGSNEISNLVISCPRCNIAKSARLPHEWPDGGRLL